jgi:site-specific recombinase XerD
MATYYLNKNTGTYHLNYIDPKTGKRYRPAIGNLEQAKKALIKLQYEIQNGYFTSFQEVGASLYFHEYANFLERIFKNKTAQRYKAVIVVFSQWLKMEYPNLKLHEISSQIISQYKNKRQKDGKSNRTVNTELYAISGGFEYAIENELITKNPTRKVKKLSEYKNPFIYWEENECNKIIHYFYEINDPENIFLGDIFTVFFNTGLRRDELRFLLKKQDFIITDNEKGIIHIRPKKLPSGENWVPKWDISRRIPVNQTTFRILVKYSEMNKKSQYLFPYIFAPPEVIPKNYLRNRLIDALKKMNMYEPGYTLHTTRHSFATAMANKPNVDIRAVQDILGHSSLETTMRYVHTSDQRKDYAINQINIGNNL